MKAVPQRGARLQRPRPLESIADEESLTMADVVLLSGVSTSTVSRLWSDHFWLDRVAGATLQNLVAVIPDLAEYVTRRSRARVIEAALLQCADVGLEVSISELDALMRRPDSGRHVAAVLSAATSVMRQDRRSANAWLTRSWGSAPDVALDALFSSGPSSLLINQNCFLSQATRMVETGTNTSDNSLYSTVGSGILVHKLAKVHGASPITVTDAPQRSSAFLYRSSRIGTILANADVDVARRYAADVRASPLLQRNEIWSLASYSADLAQSTDFSLPPTTTLIDTVEIILHDLEDRNEAYVHYLVTTAIVAVLAHDNGFGTSKSRLADTLRHRIDDGIHDSGVRSACDALLTVITSTGDTGRRDAG
ncbi:LacI family DNA-binding transcriptional regulator [Rhodococcus sp. IEGM 1381]|uniref:LacI family DNA-binding transcriptional regulator n=1 Tax=Rhodococcus sp. IEGM 1381 TaxID=3047085 RepID=UPI0024B841CF|nr:LacI family DNA-binding transcriptional regulator [Rhodococcus sp. IEGM 1381]MDI9894018.1 LacI family DNA-binding transcriptional regulator [Rhodococcus sp. IEGM 1381]